MSLMKYEGLSYPTHLLKIGGSGINNYLIEYYTRQVNIFARRNVLHTLLAANKAKRTLNRHISCSCSEPIYSKCIKKNRKKSHF